MKKNSHGRNLIVTTALCLILAGCAVGPDYKMPDLSLPANWFSAPDQKADPEKEAIDQQWWKHFNDPVLSQLIDKAGAGNFDLKIAEARITQARAARASATSDLLPTVDTVGGADRQANRIAFGGSGPFDLTKPFSTYQTGFDATWELDLFGGKRREVEADTATLKAAQASRDDVRVSLMAEVAKTYVDIRQYQQQIAIVGDTQKADEKTLKIAKERFDSGSTAGLDVTQAEAQLELAKTQLPYYQNLLVQAELSMDVLTGEQPGATHKLTEAIAPIPVTDKDVVLAAPASVIANRPDIRVAEHKLASATAQEGVATAQFFPDVSLSGFFGLLNTQAGSLLKGGSKSWDAAGNVVWPILNFGKLTANLDMAKAGQQAALAEYQKAVLAALADVEKSYTAYTKQQQYREGLSKTEERNRHAADIAQMRYKEGLSSFIEVLDAQRTLYGSQSQLAAAKATSAGNTIALYKSLGGGWK